MRFKVVAFQPLYAVNVLSKYNKSLQFAIYATGLFIHLRVYMCFLDFRFCHWK